MKYHVLAGDALAKDFKRTNIDGEVVVCRECLIEGDLQGAILKDFWNARAKFIETAYGATGYREKVVGEFEKLLAAPEGAEVNLWFEYDLFCQANLWFCSSLLQNKQLEIYRVAPIIRDETDVWKGFGGLEREDLEKCYAAKIKFTSEDVSLGTELWKAFQNKNSVELRKLGATKSACFPKLAEVCAAAIEIESRPPAVLREITANGESDFNEIFTQFAAKEGIYGFGDAQVKRILEQV